MSHSHPKWNFSSWFAIQTTTTGGWHSLNKLEEPLSSFMESHIFIFIHIHTFRHEGEVLIFILAFQSICGDAAGCGTALLFSTLTCSVLSIALQLFASGGNYTACFSISKLCLFFPPIFHLKVMTDIKDRVSKPQVTSPCVKPPIKNSVAM